MDYDEVELEPTVCDMAACVATIAGMMDDTTNKKARGYMEDTIKLMLVHMERAVNPKAEVTPMYSVPTPKDPMDKPL